MQKRRQLKRQQEVVDQYAVITEINRAYYDDISAEQMDLERAMLSLSPDESAAVSLCHSYGFSHSEVAAIMNKPLGTVKSHIKRGKQKLMKILSTKGTIDELDDTSGRATKQFGSVSLSKVESAS